MARMKKTSKTVESARVRLAGLKSINPALDLGNDMTVANYITKIEGTDADLSKYNTTLSQADEDQNRFEASENDLKDYSERMLLAVAAKYGKNSNEYEKAGGTKKSEKKKPTKDKDKNKPE